MQSLKQLMDMTGRVVLITGGAGHIGMAIAECLTELGARVVLLDLGREKLEQAMTKLDPSHYLCADFMVVDLERTDDLCVVAQSIEDRFGRLDALINNAGFVGTSDIDGWVTDFEHQTIATWKRAIEVNLTSVFALTQACTPMLRRSGHGSVVNISSIYGSLGPDLSLYDGTSMGNPAAYAASKGGVNQLTRWLSTVLAPEIRVNSISPGGIERGQPQRFRERYIERTPLKRMARDEDIKGAAAFLASDMSRYVTGQNLLVDGGWSVW